MAKFDWLIMRRVDIGAGKDGKMRGAYMQKDTNGEVFVP